MVPLANEDRLALMDSYAQQFPMGQALQKYMGMLDMPFGDLQKAVNMYKRACRALNSRELLFCTELVKNGGDANAAYRMAYACNGIKDKVVNKHADNLLKIRQVQEHLEKAKLLDKVGDKEVLRVVSEIVLSPDARVKASDRLKAAETYFKHIGAFDEEDVFKDMTDDELDEIIETAGLERQPSRLEGLRETNDDEDSFEF